MEESVKMAIYQIGLNKPHVAKEAMRLLTESNLLTEESITAAAEGETLVEKIDRIVSDEQYAKFS